MEKPMRHRVARRVLCPLMAAGLALSFCGGSVNTAQAVDRAVGPGCNYKGTLHAYAWRTTQSSPAYVYFEAARATCAGNGYFWYEYESTYCTGVLFAGSQWVPAGRSITITKRAAGPGCGVKYAIGWLS